jgi:predicted transcriptional regulator
MAPDTQRDGHEPQGRSRLGPLERATMSILWDEPNRSLTVRQVSERLNPDLAYTTVMTLLSRLHDKGHVERRRQGRAWAYRPVLSRNEHIAKAMTAALRESDDHADALLHFVEHLTMEDQQALRRRLGEEDDQ